MPEFLFVRCSINGSPGHIKARSRPHPVIDVHQEATKQVLAALVSVQRILVVEKQEPDDGVDVHDDETKSEGDEQLCPI